MSVLSSRHLYKKKGQPKCKLDDDQHSVRLRYYGPTPARLEWQSGELNVLHWQNEPWIRLKNMPSLLPAWEALQLRAGNWWRKVRHTLPFIG